MPGARHPRVPPHGAPLRLVGVAFGLLLALGSAGQARAAGPIVPDSSCADESTYKSMKGVAPAQLEVFNKSPETVKVWWLDYSGKRVFYQDLPPFTMYVQPTWLTHPWVITNVGGQCYRFLVMTSQLQSVTVEGEPPDPVATTVPLSERATAAPTGAPTVTAAGDQGLTPLRPGCMVRVRPPRPVGWCRTGRRPPCPSPGPEGPSTCTPP